MRSFLILSLFVFNLNLFANDNESLIYKDFLQDPVSFSDSEFFKSFKNNKDYKRFFNSFVDDRELSNSLNNNNSLLDVLNVCYLTYLEEDKTIYNLSKNEGKYCLYNLANSGISEAFSYIANYHFNEYKKRLYNNNKVDIDELIKVSYYFGLADSSNLSYDLGNTILDLNIMTFEEFIEDSLVKVNNKNVLKNYFDNAKLISINLPVNSLTLSSEYNNFFNELSENYKNSFSEEDIKLFESIRKSNYRLLESLMNELNDEENTYLSNINYKEIGDIYKLCSDALFSRESFKIKSNIPEFCLSQISLNTLNPDSSYDLGLYFYLVANSQEDINTKQNILNKSIFWLALSSELGNKKSSELFKRLLVDNKSNGLNKYIITYNNNRKISKLLIDNKIKNK